MTGEGSIRTQRRRVFLVLVLALFLAPISLVVGGTLGAGPFARHACGCTSPAVTHDPDWTASPPPPVSPEAAAANVSRLAGVSVAPDSKWTPVGGVPVSEPRSGAVYGFVDGNSGKVLEVAFIDRLPEFGPATSAFSPEDARATAETFLARGGVTVEGLPATAQFDQGPSVSFFRVTWAQPDGVSPAIEVMVNGISGAVFAYRDLRSGIKLGAPVVGYAAAVRMAASSPLAKGETPGAVESPPWSSLDVWLKDSGPDWIWSVGFNDGVLTVNAVTGELSVGKWIASK